MAKQLMTVSDECYMDDDAEDESDEDDEISEDCSFFDDE